MLSRPKGSPSLQQILAQPGAPEEAARGLGLWEHCTGADSHGGAAWQQLGHEGELHAFIRRSLAAFTRLKCCEGLLGGSADVVRWSSHASVPDQPSQWGGLVLLDAGGGPVDVQWQTWQDMIRAKMHATSGSALT